MPQYVKDLSFESPNGPFVALRTVRAIKHQRRCARECEAENHYEVDLILSATGKHAQGTPVRGEADL